MIQNAEAGGRMLEGCEVDAVDEPAASTPPKPHKKQDADLR
jgi:hypothetical protein